MALGKNRLRICGGVLRGRWIATPPKSRPVRPILERVKESLFSILASRVPEAQVLDLFAGTGAIGLEALSRGSRRVVFVEGDRRNIPLINGNIASLGLEGCCQVVCGKLPAALERVTGKFDLVFCDPPFGTDLSEQVLATKNLLPLLGQNATIVVRRDRREPLASSFCFEVERSHRVGDNVLWLLRKGLKDE